MLSLRSRRRLSSISAWRISGRPRPEPPPPPPFVATTQCSGSRESAIPIVCSLSPPVYVWAVSIIPTPAATASFTKATFAGVFLRRFVPSPMRATSVSPTFSFMDRWSSTFTVPVKEPYASLTRAGAALRGRPSLDSLGCLHRFRNRELGQPVLQPLELGRVGLELVGTGAALSQDLAYQHETSDVQE